MRIRRRGELVLPKAVRDRLGWRDGDLLVAVVEGDHLVLRRVMLPEAVTKAHETGPPASHPVDLSEEETRLLDALGTTPLHPDQLVARTGLHISKVLSNLVFLEIKGLARWTGYGSYIRTDGGGASSRGTVDG